MAKVFPDGWRELEATGAAGRELQTLGQLASGLDDTYAVYHGVHWTRVERSNYAIVGEIDFAIVGPTGKLLLIEQKTGLLTETAQGLVKKYAGKDKDVPFQLARNADALHERLRKVCGSDQTFVDTLLYCPDYTVREPGTAGIDPARIVDATRKEHLLTIIRAILPASGEVLPAKPKIQRFLSEILELVPEVHAVVGETSALTTRRKAASRVGGGGSLATSTVAPAANPRISVSYRSIRCSSRNTFDSASLRDPNHVTTS